MFSDYSDSENIIEYDSDYEEYLDEIERKRLYEEQLINDLKIIMYLGPLYDKCKLKIGVTKKELEKRLDRLKELNKIDKDCSLNYFINMCKLNYLANDENRNCFLNIHEMVQKYLTNDLVFRSILNNDITSDMIDFLLSNFFLGYNDDVLKSMLIRSFNVDTITRYITEFRLYDDEIYQEKIDYIPSKNEFVEFFKYKVNFIENYNYRGKLKTKAKRKYIVASLAEGIISDDFEFDLKFTIIKLLKIGIRYKYLYLFNLEDLDSKNKLEIIFERIKLLDNPKYASEGIIELIIAVFSKSDEEGYPGADIIYDLLSLLKEKYIEIYRDLLRRTYNKIDNYLLISVPYFMILQDIGELDQSFDIQAYTQDFETVDFHRLTQLELVNVHQFSTNKRINKYIKNLIPNETNNRDILDVKRTTDVAKNFVRFLKNYNLNENLSYDLRVEDILLCRSYFYDYKDLLTGRENTPPGEGVEICNIFIKLWDRARNTDPERGPVLTLDQKKHFAIRLAEELISILDRDQIGNSHPVCSTGWATRLVNSLIGTSLDLEFEVDPDVKLMEERINDFLRNKINELSGEEQDKLSDSMIGEDNYVYINEMLYNEVLPGIITEFKEKGFPPVLVRSNFYNAVNKMFPSIE